MSPEITYTTSPAALTTRSGAPVAVDIAQAHSVEAEVLTPRRAPDPADEGPVGTREHFGLTGAPRPIARQIRTDHEVRCPITIHIAGLATGPESLLRRAPEQVEQNGAVLTTEQEDLSPVVSRRAGCEFPTGK